MFAGAEVKQLVSAGTVALFVEINHLHVAVFISDLGEIQLRLAVEIQKQCVAIAINAIIRIDPLFVTRDRFTVLPHDSFARGQSYQGRSPGQRRQKAQRCPHYNGLACGTHDHFSGQEAVDRMAGANGERMTHRCG